jgi:hypothetical protein
MEEETREVLERKIVLKRQLVYLTQQEIAELQAKLIALKNKEKASEQS